MRTLEVSKITLAARRGSNLSSISGRYAQQGAAIELIQCAVGQSQFNIQSMQNTSDSKARQIPMFSLLSPVWNDAHTRCFNKSAVIGPLDFHWHRSSRARRVSAQKIVQRDISARPLVAAISTVHCHQRSTNVTAAGGLRTRKISASPSKRIPANVRRARLLRHCAGRVESCRASAAVGGGVRAVAAYRTAARAAVEAAFNPG